jgi:hypothetical protein
MIDSYTWPGGSEAMLRFGPDHSPVVVVALPLFEEANRTRAFAVTILRLLAQRGIGGALPDMPGQGESLAPLETLTILTMQHAFEHAVAAAGAGGRHCYTIGIRSGAMLDALSLVYGRWHLAPQDGPDLLRELARIKGIRPNQPDAPGDWWFDDAADWPADAPDPPIEIAGNLISTDLLTELTVKTCLSHAETHIPLRIVRLEGDPRPADAQFAGAPLWRRIEPDNDPALAALLADDIATWVRACGG